MAKPRQLPRSEECREPLPGEGHLCEHGPRTFTVWFRPNFALVCDPDQPLQHNCPVVAKIEIDGSTGYYQGKVLTKHPAKAKSIDVALNNGGLVRRASKADLAPVVGEYHKREIVIEAEAAS